MTSDATGMPPSRVVFFISDSTGITAETLGNALLANFPTMVFQRHTVPFVDSREQALKVAREIRASSQSGSAPVVFTTVKSDAVRAVLASSGSEMIDLLGGHLKEVGRALGASASQLRGRFHGVGDLERYFARMRAIEYAIEHDDGQSVRALEHAEVIIIAPSRCGKTPTTMYLALQYGLLAANYPLTDDDFPSEGLPSPISEYGDRCFGLTTAPTRLSEVRWQRRPDSHYASLERCSLELRRAENLYRSNSIPYLNSSAKSVEEMSAVILHSMKLRG